MTSDDLPQRSRRHPQDLHVVQALTVASRWRDPDGDGRSAIAMKAGDILRGLGLGEGPLAAPGDMASHLDRSQLPLDERDAAALVATLRAVEESPTDERRADAERALDELAQALR